jgi:hypothetical protein
MIVGCLLALNITLSQSIDASLLLNHNAICLTLHCFIDVSLIIQEIFISLQENLFET